MKTNTAFKSVRSGMWLELSCHRLREFEDIVSGGEVNWLSDRLASRVFQSSILRMLIWPEASNAQNNIAAVLAEGSTVCLDPLLELLVQALDRVGVHKSEPTDIGIVADPSVALAALAATIERHLTEDGRSASRRRTYQAAQERKQRGTVPLGRAERPMSPQHMAHAQL
jgi:hypothetical protein